MNELCDFSESATCPRCGYVAKTLPHRRVCKPPGTLLRRPPQPDPNAGLLRVGDAVAAGLAAVGITPQLVQRVTGRKACGCKQRQRRLNEAGFAVQRAVREFYLGQ